MGKTVRIGLFFSYNKEWIAGTYYVLNIIKALKVLPKKQQPAIVIITKEKKDFTYVVKETKYPKLSHCIYPIQPPNYTLVDRLINKVSYTLAKKKLINRKPKKAEINFLYPYYLDNIASSAVKRVNWIPDFQELHLPHLFTSAILKERKRHQQEIATHSDCLVVSSEDAKKDFYTAHPDAKTAVYKLPFAVTLPNFEKQDINFLLKKYQLPTKFYFAPNQFWTHKNHIVILKALCELKKKGIPCVVAFSGNENDPRNKDYVSTLKDYIQKNDITERVHFLGFMPREEQLKLMKHSVAIIQPSKFEGWSTVVEDSKALNKFIIASSIAVHKEQTNNNVQFFDPDDPNELANYMNEFWLNPPKVARLDYNIERSKFAANFMRLVDQYSNTKNE